MDVLINMWMKYFHNIYIHQIIMLYILNYLKILIVNTTLKLGKEKQRKKEGKKETKKGMKKEGDREGSLNPKLFSNFLLYSTS